MAVTVLQPPQVASDEPTLGAATSATTAHKAGAATVTETLTLKKQTPGGHTGSVTITGGVVTSYTPAT